MNLLPDHSPQPERRPHQFRLFRQRRFAPFFWTVFLGAVNDNLLKFAIVLWLTFKAPVRWLPIELVGPVLGALFILPSVILSATLGQWADKVDMARLMRWGKSAEVAMMVLSAWAFWHGQVVVMLLCVLLSGVHVSLFATVKYAYLPRQLEAGELTGGNGLLEMGTFTAILIGTIAGGVLLSPRVESWVGGIQALVVVLVVLALVGRRAAQAIPAMPPLTPDLRINWNPLAETWQTVVRIRHQSDLLLGVLGISWMWFFGAAFLSLFPLVSKKVLHAPEDIASLLLVMSSLGVACGALVCERLSHARTGAAPDLGLVLLGAVGMAVFGLDTAWVVRQIAQDPSMAAVQVYTLADFAQRPLHWRGLADQLLMSMSIGLFSVPLYAHVQHRAEPAWRARVVAANNILNALFILLCASLTWVLSAAHWSVSGIFALVSLLHVGVMLVTVRLQPLLWVATVAWLRRWKATD